ncbi:hypothetical protein KUA24_77 [Vibrio phage HNL01]|nr:hypothetical protein KUA24_77 [Vibrio phage HNL01]
MALTNDEVLKLAGAVLSASVLDSNSQSKWFEKRNANSFIIDPKNVWGELNLLQDLPANTFAEAVANAVANPNLFSMHGINADGTFNDDTAIRLTPLAGTNRKTYIAYSEYGNGGSPILKNWILPQLIPRASGAPSAVYQAQIWMGKPSEGKQLLSSTGSDSEWTSHVWNAAAGALLISEADAPPSSSIPNADLYLTGFQYVGAGAGGGFSGSTILLESPDGSWRVRNSYPHLLFERKEEDSDGQVVWNTFATLGNSLSTDGVKLHRPYDIAVDMSSSLNDVTDSTIAPDYKSAFRVAGTNDAFIYGNTEQQTVIETKRGSDIKRAAAIREEVELENRPLSDIEVTLDTTENPEVGSVTEISWVSNVNYTTDADFIRFNELGFEVLESSDDIIGAPCRISVEFPDGRLIQENLTMTSLNAGINGGFNLKSGFHLNKITPKYTDKRDAVTITRIQLSKGHKVKLSAGLYEYTDPLDGSRKQQIVPRQKSKVEFSNDVTIWDGSNWKEEMYKDSRVWLDGGAVGAHYPEESNKETLFAKVSDHTTADEVVLGNYNDKSYVATGSGGLFVLYEDDTTFRSFWSEGDRERLIANKAPTAFQEITEFEIDFNEIFTSEMNDVGWDVVNVETLSPLIRFEGEQEIGYRAFITSNIDKDILFQESQDKFAFLDGLIKAPYSIKPTIDANEPEYLKLKLPRNKFTVNRHTPRRITYQFQEPVKVYGYYKDIIDPADPTTGTFVPSVKAEVMRVFEEEVVSGSTLEDRLDSVQGEIEWNKAVEGGLPTIHEFPSLLVWATEDDEWIFWSDQDALYSDQDEQQWVFTEAGTEAYFELKDTQGSWSNSNSVFTFNPCVVNIPYERTNSFEVSFGWHESFNDNSSLEYGVFKFFINSHGRSQDSEISINIPRNASITWRFRKRRTGNFSYIATPANDNLASTQIQGIDLAPTIPVDPNPPILGGSDI